MIKIFKYFKMKEQIFSKRNHKLFLWIASHNIQIFYELQSKNSNESILKFVTIYLDDYTKYSQHTIISRKQKKNQFC